MKVNFLIKPASRTFPFLLLFVLPMFFATSCRSTKEVAKAIDNSNVDKTDKKQVFKAIEKNRFEFNYFSTSASCNYRDKQNKYSFTLDIRMKRDEKIWMSASALFFQAARVLITKDSVHIINYFDKSVTSRSINFISQYIGQKLTIGQIQDVLVGNSIVEHKEEISSYVLSDDRPTVITRLNQFLFNEIFHYEHFRPTYVKGDETGSVNKVDLEYKDFVQVNNRLVPQFAKVVAVTNNNAITATLKYSDISTEEIKNWPFSIPASYERK